MSHPLTDDRSRRLVVLGSEAGWHAEQLRHAACRLGASISFASYESLAAQLSPSGEVRFVCSAGELDLQTLIIARTMPAGTLEQITFRLAMLHEFARRGGRVINSPRALELAIDKFATLAIVASLGYPIPATRVVQSRSEALDAFAELGGDCVVKPIFGGEGRGVMRIQDKQLAWTAFSTLEQLGAIAYVQAFVPPGGRDTRLLVIGDDVIAIRRTNDLNFRTNVSGGGNCESLPVATSQQTMGLEITRRMGLRFAAVDVLDADHGPPRVVEVNGIPGWRGAQGVLSISIAELFVRTAISDSTSSTIAAIPDVGHVT
jgi:ribosomal protein S6--L-glutamate ligase